MNYTNTTDVSNFNYKFLDNTSIIIIMVISVIIICYCFNLDNQKQNIKFRKTVIRAQNRIELKTFG